MNSATLQLFLLAALSLPFESLQQQRQPSFLTCSSKEKCDECIRTFGCVWCSDPNASERRCQRQGESKCDASFIMDPKIEVSAAIENPLTEVRPKGYGSSITTSQENVVQVTPQYYKIRMRPNEGNPYRINLLYRQAVDYPVDLYYLMDLSNSMKDDKEKLSSLGKKLSDTMENITSNFRLGFGSFVDKVVMPYVSIVPKNLIEPCTGCAAPYGFRNVMSLSQDTFKFADLVASANVSGNLDAPEGGFDAIMQAIVCREHIGWRDKARKLLVFSTDSSFHYAGDGKLGGIIKPNDGCCHLDNNGLYTQSIHQDYPSVSQINMKIKENSINVIFAVTQNQVNLYKRLGDHIEGSSTGELSADSGNVVELVSQQYDKITSSVEMRESNLGNHLRVKYYTRCLNADGPLMQTNKCDGLKVGQTVEFAIDVELLSCPVDHNEWNHRFYIYPVGVSENLTVDVDMLCDCMCQYPGHPSYEENSPKCSYHGTLKCGICECDVGYQGEDCNCTSDADKIDKCRPNPDAPLCSDHGTCKCNKCYCNSYSATEVFWGDYCECNNFSCPRVNGKLCSDHGECICGKCKCAEGWIDEDCSCENSTTNCVSGLDDSICSGHGKCVCNKCVCDVAGEYSGKYCDKCPTCMTKCAELKDCVQCKVHNSGPLTKEECDKCNATINVVDYLTVVDQDYFCAHYDDQDCRYIYIYEITGKQIVVTAQKNKECPPQARILGVVFMVILSIVLIGIAFLMVWKLWTSQKDRREFAKFEKERMMAKWDTGQNPIYKQATSTYRNPIYCAS